MVSSKRRLPLVLAVVTPVAASVAASALLPLLALGLAEGRFAVAAVALCVGGPLAGVFALVVTAEVAVSAVDRIERDDARRARTADRSAGTLSLAAPGGELSEAEGGRA